SRNIQAVEELFDRETRSEQSFYLRQLIDSDHQIEVQADQRLDIRIHPLAADHTIADLSLLQQRDQQFKEIGAIQSHGFPKGRGAHASPQWYREGELYLAVCRLSQPIACYCGGGRNPIASRSPASMPILA